MKSFIVHAALVVVLCLAAGVAIAGECQPVEVRIGPSTYLDSCPPGYLYCIDAPLKGTFNGTWHFYGDGGQVEGEPGVENQPYSWLWAGWALDVIETNRGTIYAQDNWMWNLSALESGSKAGLPMVTISNITGGTDAYEGATGWIRMILDDQGYWRGFMKGEICTP